MRDLVISVIAVSLLLGAWFVFGNISEKAATECTSVISDEILPAAKESRWEDCSTSIIKLEAVWEKYRKSAVFFISSDTLNEIDCTLAKSKQYIYAADLSNSSGELDSLMKQILFLNSNEKLSMANIF